MGNVNREVGVLRKNQNEVLNVKTKQKPEIKDAFDGLINRLYTSKERINALVKICQKKFPKQK